MEKKSHFERTARPQKHLAIWGAKKRVDFKVLKWTLFFAPQMAKYLKKNQNSNSSSDALRHEFEI